jgi:hypothetical protein
MSDTHALPEYYDGSGLYEVRLKGHLDGAGPTGLRA